MAMNGRTRVSPKHLTADPLCPPICAQEPRVDLYSDLSGSLPSDDMAILCREKQTPVQPLMKILSTRNLASSHTSLLPVWDIIENEVTSWLSETLSAQNHLPIA